MVRRGTGLHADQAWRQSLEERRNLAAAKLLSDDDLLGRVNAVNLKHVLGDIQTDRGNLHVDGSPDVIRLRRTTLWHLDAGSGRRPPHQTWKWHRYSTASSIDATRGAKIRRFSRALQSAAAQSPLLREKRNPLRPSTARDS